MGSLPMPNCLKQFQVQAQCCYGDFEVMIFIHLKKQKGYTATLCHGVVFPTLGFSYFAMSQNTYCRVLHSLVIFFLMEKVLKGMTVSKLCPGMAS